MSAAWMLFAVLSAPPEAPAPQPDQRPAAVQSPEVASPERETESGKLSREDDAPSKTTRTAEPVSPRQALREEYVALMAQTAERLRPDPERCVPELVALRQRVAEFSELAEVERRRMLRGLDARLVRVHTRLRHDLARAEREDRRNRGHAPSSSGGGAVAVRAQELIDLIRMTVAPETWDINGGRGTIRYWAPGMALVIRQTGEVHHQVGGTLGQIRRAQP